MRAREWWPLDWADEVMPHGRGAPDEFIVDTGGHYWLGYAFDAEGVSDFDKRYYSKALERDEIVNFICCDELGEVEVTINPDGTYSVSGDVPERATHFCKIGDPDTLIEGSLKEFVAAWHDMEPPSEPVTIAVAMAWWSDALPYKLTLTYGAARTPSTIKASFVPVSVAEARQ